MVKNLPFQAFTVLCIVMLGIGLTQARTMEGISKPDLTQQSAVNAYCNTVHNVGRIALGVSNDGTFGTLLSVSGSATDCFTGERLPACQYPKGSNTRYIFGAALWMGAVLGRDTLVSTAADGWSVPGSEFHPDAAPFGDMIYRSTIDPARPEFKDAVSEQDYLGVYYDTCHNCQGVGNDPRDNRAHLPLNIEVSQRTYAWSYSYAQDFVLFDYSIKNIGRDRLRRVYMGIYVDADIHDEADQRQNGAAQDDLCGFRRWQPALYLPDHFEPDSDVVNIAWTADNDGDLGEMALQHVTNITATRIIRTPSDSLEVSFNWWVSNQNASQDYGPQTRAHPRDMGTGGLGTPEGDRNKFYILSNGEFDFDQPRVCEISSLDEIWLPPPSCTWARGLDTRYVLSFGPFDIEPGQSLPVTLAYVGGVDFHRTEANFDNLPNNPDSWYQGVNFDSLGSNATWAEWVYDNPGVDTDSDGYAGEFRVANLTDDSTLDSCVYDTITVSPILVDTVCYYSYELADTIWHKGDGVPDFRGATPPPAPSTYSVKSPDGRIIPGLRVEPEVGRIKIRWNGVLSENTADVFSRELDFEGYRVYLSRDDRSSSYGVVASYDIEDYNRYDYDASTGNFNLNEAPFTLRDLRCMYAPDSCDDENWHPLDFPRYRPLQVSATEVYYFVPQDYNQSILANEGPQATSPLAKTYPNAPVPPVLEPDSIRVLFPDTWDIYLTEEGFIKAFEYEYTVENLLPTVPYWLNVTAFDYGSPQSGLAALETSVTLQPITTYALESVARVDDLGLEVYVYPNPYRADGEYLERGFEDRTGVYEDYNRARRIHFANLPAKCTIRIFSLDGDLVIEKAHSFDIYDPEANHDTWNLITRNSQLVVSGLYYWTVEDEEGNTQIGKLAIIM
jgi:hypothetical protein